jgi:hypothetical protein
MQHKVSHPVPQTLLPPQLSETPPVCLRHAPIHCNPFSTPDTVPEAPQHSLRRNKGVAPGPNFWNVTDYLHGNVHSTRVESHCKLSLHCPSCMQSAQPSPSSTPDPAAWQELSVPILSNKEEEEAAALPGSPQNPNMRSESNDEDITIDSCEDLASSSACCTVLEDSAHHTLKVQAFIAQGLAAVWLITSLPNTCLLSIICDFCV